MSTQTPVKSKRKVEDTDFTRDKLPYKVGNNMDTEETDMNFLKETGKCLPKLLRATLRSLTKHLMRKSMS